MQHPVGVFIFADADEAFFTANGCYFLGIKYCLEEYEDLEWLFIFESDDFDFLKFVVTT